MDARLQRRVQRYGWNRAAARYDSLWRAHLAKASDEMLRQVPPAPGQQVLDVACGPASVSVRAARMVGSSGRVVGIDLSDEMVDAARKSAIAAGRTNTEFLRMDGESLRFADASFDVALCAFGLMYMPEPEQALREMRRVLRPAGRVALAVWGERARCAWSTVFEIVDQEVSSEVCPLFFRLGQDLQLQQVCAGAGFDDVRLQRIASALDFGSADEACDAALLGGPVALAWSRMDAAARSRVSRRYLDSLSPWRHGAGFRVPAEFVIVSAVTRRPG